MRPKRVIVGRLKEKDAEIVLSTVRQLILDDKITIDANLKVESDHD